jgi:hypothetical protein
MQAMIRKARHYGERCARSLENKTRPEEFLTN